MEEPPLTSLAHKGKRRGEIHPANTHTHNVSAVDVLDDDVVGELRERCKRGSRERERRKRNRSNGNVTLLTIRSNAATISFSLSVCYHLRGELALACTHCSSNQLCAIDYPHSNTFLTSR